MRDAHAALQQDHFRPKYTCSDGKQNHGRFMPAYRINQPFFRCHYRTTYSVPLASPYSRTILYPWTSSLAIYPGNTPKKYNPSVSLAHALETLPAIIHAGRMFLPRYGLRDGTCICRYISQVSASFFLASKPSDVCAP